MNMNRLTQKSLAAIQSAQSIAVEHGNQQIEQAHLLCALVGDEEGLVPQLLTAMGMTPARWLSGQVRTAVRKIPGCGAWAGSARR